MITTHCKKRELYGRPAPATAPEIVWPYFQTSSISRYVWDFSECKWLANKQGLCYVVCFKIPRWKEVSRAKCVILKFNRGSNLKYWEWPDGCHLSNVGCQPGSGETLADKLGIKLTSREISTPSQLLISVYFYDDYTAGTICVPVITLKLRHGTDLTSDESPSLILYWCVSIANIQQISKPNIASPLVTSPEVDTRFIRCKIRGC